MHIGIDDWHFRESSSEMLLLDVFLDNGQHSVMEVYPMKCVRAVNGDIPEIIVFCEMPGERLSEKDCPARWVTRPPTRDCRWSNVELPHALMQQIKDRLMAPGAPMMTSTPVATAHVAL